MAHLHKLSDRFVRNAKIGMHSDGGGLYLRVTGKTARSWLFVYRVGTKRTELGLGGYPAITLSRARELAAELRAARAEGIDPKEARTARKRRSVTFGDVAGEALAAWTPGWTARHAGQVRKSLTVDAAALRDMPIAAVDTAAVLSVLQPRWLTTPDTAQRLRLRLELLLDYAKAKGLRDGENPARWRGHLRNLLPRQNKIRQHYAAMDYRDLPQFMAEVRNVEGYGALALHLLVLAAARTTEVIGARWSEFDLEAKVWLIPAHRTKSRRQHVVPLSDQAISVIRELWEVRRGQFLIPSYHADRQQNDHGPCDQEAAGPDRDGSWHARELPNLGCGADELPARDHRGLPRACRWRSDRAQLPAW
jgi:integrase